MKASGTARSLLLALALASGLTLGPAPALARGRWDDLYLMLGALGETAVPDLRYQLPLDDGDHGLVVSWPITADLMLADEPKGFSLALQPLVEPQIVVGEGGRFLYGARAIVSYFLGALVEGGGAACLHGHGGFVGAGLAWRARWAHFWPSVSLVYRRYLQPDALTHDVALDVTIPWPVLDPP